MGFLAPDSYAPPGLFVGPSTNPTAGAVGYVLAPLRGYSGPNLRICTGNATEMLVRTK